MIGVLFLATDNFYVEKETKAHLEAEMNLSQEEKLGKQGYSTP